MVKNMFAFYQFSTSKTAIIVFVLFSINLKSESSWNITHKYCRNFVVLLADFNYQYVFSVHPLLSPSCKMFAILILLGCKLANKSTIEFIAKFMSLCQCINASPFSLSWPIVSLK